jgi:hypothetical protein
MQDATIFDDEGANFYDRDGAFDHPGLQQTVRPQLLLSLVVTIIITAATGLTLMTLVSREPVSHHRMDGAPHRIAAIQHPPLALAHDQSAA